MNNLPTILDAIKQHGVGVVVSVAMFLYFNSRISEVEQKYDDCMNERINEAYRVPRTSQNKPDKRRLYAILVEPIKPKKREPNQ
jgi:hypothetical protein